MCYFFYSWFNPIQLAGSITGGQSDANPACVWLCDLDIFVQQSLAPYRGALHDVPPDGLVPAPLAELQQVVHHHLADQVVSGEAVEVVHGEMQLPGMQLVQWHAELKRLVEHWVQGLSVDLRRTNTEKWPNSYKTIGVVHKRGTKLFYSLQTMLRHYNYSGKRENGGLLSITAHTGQIYCAIRGPVLPHSQRLVMTVKHHH